MGQTIPGVVSSSLPINKTRNKRQVDIHCWSIVMQAKACWCFVSRSHINASHIVSPTLHHINQLLACYIMGTPPVSKQHPLFYWIVLWNLIRFLLRQYGMGWDGMESWKEIWKLHAQYGKIERQKSRWVPYFWFLGEWLKFLGGIQLQSYFL